VAYGPDDPAYGPPGRDWYERAESEAARRQESGEELRQARGPFEPLPPDHEVTTPPPPDFGTPASVGTVGRADTPSRAGTAAGAGTAASTGDTGFRRSGGPPPDHQADHQADPPVDPDIDPHADDLDVAVVGQGTGPLERIKDLYATAEAIGERRLDKHFDQLLERQRHLISDYFANQEFRGPAGVGPIGAGPTAPGPVGAAPAAPGPVGAAPAAPGPSAAGQAASSPRPRPTAPGDDPAGAGDPAGIAAPRNDRMSFDAARRSRP
jgi:hypothetical protein